MRYKKENEKLLIIIQKEKKPCLSLMNRFNALVNVQHFDAQNCNTRKKKRKKNMQFTAIWNKCDIAKHFEILTIEI